MRVYENWEPIGAFGLLYPGTPPPDNIRADSTFPQLRPENIFMVITSAHIQPIVALVAGILILLMPRLLNLIVAIYLIFIGLVGLGVLRMFHLG